MTKVVLLLLLVEICLCLCVPPEDFLRAQYPFFGISEIAATSKIEKSNCSYHLKSVYYAVKKKEPWALRMFDSSGAPKNGFIWGNNYWLGSYSQCRWMASKRTDVQPKVGSAKYLENSPFGVDFYVASFKHNAKIQTKINTPQEDLIVIGLCLPSVCTTKDLEPILTSWSTQDPLTPQLLYNFTMQFRNIRVIKDESVLTDNLLAILLSVISGIIAIMVFAGTLYDVHILPSRQSRCQSEGKPDISDSRNVRNIQENDELLNRDNNINDGYELKIDNSLHKSIPVPVTIRHSDGPPVNQSKCTRLIKNAILCFSVTSNARAMVETNYDKDNIPMIHGLRFLGMVWVIVLYTVYYVKDFADNKPLLLRISQGFSEQLISNSTFSVDIFFFTSGFLLSYIYYRNRRGSSRANDNYSIKKSVNEFCLMLLKRLMRLTPVYLFVLAIVNISIKQNNKTSLFEVTELSQNVCEKFWWRNLLYINNLFRSDEMCMSWSWYISTEVQFFMLGALLLIISSRYWRLSIFLIGTITVLSSSLIGYLSYIYSFSPRLDQQLASLHILHLPPWARVTPYLFGLCSGYIVLNLKGKLVFNKATLITCWTVASLCNFWALFGLYNKEMSVISTAMYNALSRPAWSFGLTWTIVACTTSNAGIVNEILSFRGWIPFSKLSFTAYLLGPLIINLIYSSSETPLHLDSLPMTVYFIGFTGITYFSAFLLTLTVELPFSQLGRRLIGKNHVINQLN